MLIKEATTSDIDDVLRIERAAFGGNEEAELVENLLADPSAEPVLSLLAFMDGEAVGHILFTAARLEGRHQGLTVSLLAPLAVVPEHQKQGIGGKLIEAGLRTLSDRETDLVFVLGYPEYYTRHGFQPAFPHGLEATYSIPEKVSDAWMVQALRSGLLGSITGRLQCCDAMNRPEYWRE